MKVAAIVLLLSTGTALADDTGWRLASGFYFGGVAADWYTTERNLDGPHVETNPLLGENPSDLRLTAQMAVMSGLIYYGASRARVKHPKATMALLIILGAVHARAAYHNHQIAR